ncbi:MAG: copper chaperone [Clostridia bacterium]|nr:MAG: copper chaperone [Clostridia bacterium]
MAQATLHIEGMSCHHCQMAVEKALRSLPGVSQAEVNLEAEAATVVYDPGVATIEAMREAVDKAGYKVV